MNHHTNRGIQQDLIETGQVRQRGWHRPHMAWKKWPAESSYRMTQQFQVCVRPEEVLAFIFHLIEFSFIQSIILVKFKSIQKCHIERTNCEVILVS